MTTILFDATRTVKPSLASILTDFLKARGYSNEQIQASHRTLDALTPEDAASVQRIVNDHTRYDVPKSDEPATVDCLTWSGDILGDPYSPERLRVIAIGLLNENLLGARFVPPTMTEAEADERDLKVRWASYDADAASVPCPSLDQITATVRENGERIEAIGQRLEETQARLNALTDPVDALEANVCELLGSRGYTIDEVAAAVGYVRAHGTGFYSEAIGEDEADEVTELVIEHTADVEYEDASQWPEAYEEWEYEDRNGVESFDGRLMDVIKATRVLGIEPDEAVRRLARQPVPASATLPALELLPAGLSPFALPSLCGGSPSPDERPIRFWDDRSGVRSRPQPNLTDEDHFIAHGCV